MPAMQYLPERRYIDSTIPLNPPPRPPRSRACTPGRAYPPAPSSDPTAVNQIVGCSTFAVAVHYPARPLTCPTCAPNMSDG